MTWVFDETVASKFSSYARQHIPNYDQVIDECISICKNVGYHAAILDVGCAIGETLTRLKAAGFNNIYGVDNSQAMLDQCPPIASLILSDDFPTGNYDVVLMNWTLHFIKDKISYIQDVYNNLNPGGVFVLSEKTSKDQYPLQFYHTFKEKQGVSRDEIIEKAQSVNDIMFINDPLWYLNILRTVGFRQVHIINASWCFTTFVCIK